jgi:hypothetical protein
MAGFDRKNHKWATLEVRLGDVATTIDRNVGEYLRSIFRNFFKIELH